VPAKHPMQRLILLIPLVRQTLS